MHDVFDLLKPLSLPDIWVSEVVLYFCHPGYRYQYDESVAPLNERNPWANPFASVTTVRYLPEHLQIMNTWLILHGAVLAKYSPRSRWPDVGIAQEVHVVEIEGGTSHHKKVRSLQGICCGIPVQVNDDVRVCIER
jgi:hypothetical protein